MTVYFYQGKPLVFGNLVGMDEACCCVECCCGPCIKFRFEIEGVTDGGSCPGCVDTNGTWITGEITPSIVDGVCVYEADVTPSPNPLADCEDPAFNLTAKITCPVEGGIRVEASVTIGIIVQPPPAPGEPAIGELPHFVLDTTVADCTDISEELSQSGTTSNICGLTGATVTLSVEPCIDPLAFVDPNGVAYESPGGENYIAPNTASVSLRAPKQPRAPEPPRSKQKRERKAKIELPICKHRGEEIGKANCGCAGKPMVWNCNLFNQPCVARAVGKPITKAGNQRISSPLACSVCECFEDR